MVKLNKKDIQFEEPSEILVLFNRYLLVLVALIIVVILVPGYFMILKPKIDSIGVSETQNTASEQRREDNEKLLSRIEDLETEYYDIINNRKEDLAFLKEILPDEVQRAEIFLMTDRLAKKHDFKLLNINITDVLAPQTDNIAPVVNEEDIEGQEEVSQAQQVNVDVSDLDALLLSTGIKTATLKFVVSRTIEKGEDITGEEVYDEFKDYLADLENNMRLMDIQSLIFGGIDEAPGAKASDSYAFTFNILTYYK